MVLCIATGIRLSVATMKFWTQYSLEGLDPPPATKLNCVAGDRCGIRPIKFSGPFGGVNPLNVHIRGHSNSRAWFIN